MQSQLERYATNYFSTHRDHRGELCIRIGNRTPSGAFTPHVSEEFIDQCLLKLNAFTEWDRVSNHSITEYTWKHKNGNVGITCRENNDAYEISSRWVWQTPMNLVWRAVPPQPAVFRVEQRVHETNDRIPSVAKLLGVIKYETTDYKFREWTIRIIKEDGNKRWGMELNLNDHEEYLRRVGTESAPSRASASIAAKINGLFDDVPIS